MYRFTNIITLFFLFFISCQLCAKNLTPSDPNDQLIKDIAIPFMKKNHVPGLAVLVYVDGKEYNYYLGYTNWNKKKPITKDTIFEIGSLTKVMTSLLLAQDVDFARVDINNKVKKYLPFLSNEFNLITFKDLATHISGLPFDMSEIKTQAQFNDYLSKYTSTYQPKTKWLYSNMGMGLLGQLLETINKTKLNDLYINRIASPLEMQAIGFDVPKNLQQHMAQGYDERDSPVQPANGFLVWAFGIKASAEDMQHFLKAAIGLPQTPLRIFYPMRMTQTAYVALPYRLQGLGWQIHKLDSKKSYIIHSGNTFGPTEVLEIYGKPVFDGDALIDKSGGTKGFRSYIAVIPNKNTGIVLLANKHVPDDTMDAMGREILFKCKISVKS